VNNPPEIKVEISTVVDWRGKAVAAIVARLTGQQFLPVELHLGAGDAGSTRHGYC
jgi:hypothetical protein